MKTWLAQALRRTANRIDPPIELRFHQDNAIVITDASRCTPEKIATMNDLSRNWKAHRWELRP